MRAAYIIYGDEGFEIFGNKEGLPKITAVIPSPDVNTKTVEEREKRFSEGINNIILNGYFIVSEKRIRNDAFDKPGQKTTLKVVYRPCKNQKEMEMVRDKIEEIICRR